MLVIGIKNLFYQNSFSEQEKGVEVKTDHTAESITNGTLDSV